MTILCGAIGVIALQFAASSAFAHGGHYHTPIALMVDAGHDHSAHRTHTQHVTGAASDVTEVSATQSSDESAPKCAPCNGACCSLQYSCSGSVIASAAPLSIGPAAGRTAIIGYAASAVLGLDPDIPPKPPKPFA